MQPKLDASLLTLQLANPFFVPNARESIDARPLFLAPGSIRGVVDIQDSETTQIAALIDTIRICLDGTLSIKIPCNRARSQSQMVCAAIPTYRKLNKRIITMDQIISVRPGEPSHPKSFPFDLDLSNPANNLPPSITFKQVTSRPTNGSPETTEATTAYTLRADAISNGRIISTTTRAIQIYPSSLPQPPIYSASPSGSTPQQTRPLRKNILGKPIARLSATAIAEPAPAIFSPDKDYATTTLPLRFTLDHRPQPPTEMDADITWRLHTSSLFSLTPLSSGIPPTTTPKSRQAPANTSSWSSLGLRHNIKLNLRNWTETGGSTTTTSTVTLLPLTLPLAAMLLPTTTTTTTTTSSSPHLHRRYSIHVSMTVRAGKALGKTSLSLEVPLQIGYREGAPPQLIGTEGRGGGRRRGLEIRDVTHSYYDQQPAPLKSPSLSPLPPLPPLLSTSSPPPPPPSLESEDDEEEYWLHRDLSGMDARIAASSSSSSSSSSSRSAPPPVYVA